VTVGTVKVSDERSRRH